MGDTGSLSLGGSIASVAIIVKHEIVLAIVGGLLVGCGEKLAEVYLGEYVGGAIENWFPYMLAMLVLMIRPEGIFGEKLIERV